MHRVKKILSGDPKRGGMALDSEESLREGEKFIVSSTLFSDSSPRLLPLPSNDFTTTKAELAPVPSFIHESPVSSPFFLGF